MPTIVNQHSVDGATGFKQIVLVQGDIAASECAAVVLSCHANAQLAPSGETIRAVAARHELQGPVLEPVIILPGGASGTYRCDWESGSPPFTTLLVRLAGANKHESEADAAAYYDRVIWSIFGTVAALELQGNGFSSIAIPLIGGRRGYAQRSSMESLIRYAAAWLQRSMTTVSVSLYAYDDSSSDQWSQSMDEALGRKYLDTAGDEVAGALRDEIVAMLDDPRVLDLFDQNGTLTPLRRALQRSDGDVCIQSVGGFGRRLVEELVSTILLANGKKPVFSLYENIQQHLRETGAVAPWIVAHCHTLREFGNEAAHAKPDPTYIPKTLSRHDLVALLSSLLRVLQFSQEWSGNRV